MKEKGSWRLFSLVNNDGEKKDDLTYFPVYGNGARGHQTVELLSNDVERKSLVTSSQGPEFKVKKKSTLPCAQEYWMPDRLCRTCYECETPFNMFRRRHHCRLCGQVFCHKCSSYLIDGRLVLLTGMVRVCTTCHQAHKAPYQVQSDRVLVNSSFLGACEKHGRSLQKNHIAVENSQSLHEYVPACSPSIARRFEEAENVAHDCFSLTVHDKLNLQQEFSETTDHATNIPAHNKNRFRCQHQATRESNLESDSSKLPCVWSVYDTWNRSMIDSPEACLRRRLLGTSSFVAPISLLNATSRNQESRAELLHIADLLRQSAILRLESMVQGLLSEYDRAYERPHEQNWGAIILRLAQEASDTVTPNVRIADTMDIRPYVKIKVIPGGSYLECRYVDGIVFSKGVVHKKMRKSACSPRILLLSGGVDFQRTHSKLATFTTLLEQEQKYTEIIVEKIIRLQPDLMCVGSSISRQAQEYLNQHDVVAVQHVKPRLMKRIARMTGAAIVPSTDYVTSMSDYRDIALGTCQHLQITTYPSVPLEGYHVKSIPKLNHVQPHCKRMRGHGYVSYVYLSGSPRFLGCTLILRGARKSELKKIKRIVGFAVFVAYHLRLECSFLRDCGAMPRHAAVPAQWHGSSIFSSSLSVDFGDGTIDSRSSSPGQLIKKQFLSTSAFDHQMLLVTSVWMSHRTQCASAEVKGVLYYTPQDVSLGQFLLNCCFNLKSKFPPGDKKSVLDMTQIFYHNNGRLLITVKMHQALSVAPTTENESAESLCSVNHDNTIFMWSYCKACEEIVSPLVPMSEDTWKMSFGKFLEVRFYNRTATCRTGNCRHCLQTNHVFFYGSRNLIARFDYERIRPYEIYVRQQLPFDGSFYYHELALECQSLKLLTLDLFRSFRAKHSELEVVMDSIVLVFTTTSNDNSTYSLLATVLGELSQISMDIESYSSWLRHQLLDEPHLHEKMWLSDNSVQLRFPAQFRRELYVRMSNWNQRFALLGQLLSSIQDKAGSYASTATDASSYIATIVGCSSDIIEAELLHLRTLTEPRFVSTSAIEEDIDEGDDFQDGEGQALPPGLPSGTKMMAAEHIGTVIGSSEEVLGDFAPANYVSTRELIKDHNNQSNCVDAPLTLNSDSQQSEYHDEEVITGIPNVQATLRGYRFSSALSRLLGTYSPEEDPWIVPLRSLEGGRPRLEIGDCSGVLLVHDEEPTTIIAYSLSTMEYKRSLATYLDATHKRNSMYYNEKPIISETAMGLKAPCGLSHSPGTGLSTITEQGNLLSSRTTTSSPALDQVGSIGALFGRKPTSPDFSMQDHSKPGISHGRCDERTVADTRQNVELALTTPLRHAGRLVKASPPYFENQMLSTQKTHIKHRFADMNEKGNTICKFVCQAYWTTQFVAVRRAFCGNSEEDEIGYLRSLSMARPWNAQGGKSGATFLKTTDGRFVVKQITRTELQMFLEYAPAYFEYLFKAFFCCYATLLVKVFGVYQIGSHNRANGKRTMEQVVVMQNLFHECSIHRVFDLKGSTRSRYARVDASGEVSKTASSFVGVSDVQPVLLDENFVEFTEGRPLPLRDQAKAYFNNAVMNDTLFLSLISVVDYSILVGMDDDNHQLVVGIIDYLRQYDIIKKVERVGKSVGMIAGQAEPTVIQPPNYRNRFQLAMEKYFMMVPDKWTSFRLQTHI